jgi:hypothetical protein
MKLRSYIMSFGFCLALFGCTEESQEPADYILRVNDYTIGRGEIDSQLKFEAELDSNFYPSNDTRTEFLKDLIQSQVLIQEAKKQHFDQREPFRQSIQRYWESTLIRDLLAEKGLQLRKTTVVNQEEIESYYQQNKEFLPEGTLEELKPELIRQIEDNKVNAQLAEWIEELESRASIEITDPDLAARVKSGKHDG